MISHNSICDWYEVSLEIPYLGDTAKCVSVYTLLTFQVSFAKSTSPLLFGKHCKISLLRK